MFETNYVKAKANKEATFFISQLKGKRFDYPICVDLEDPCQCTLDNKTLTNIALAYLNMLKHAGYYPMIYANKYWFTSVLDDTMLTSYDHWLAQYATSITYTGTVGIWQYTFNWHSKRNNWYRRYGHFIYRLCI